MLQWLLWGITALIWCVVIVQVVGNWVRYRRAVRTGRLGRKEISVHVTADFISLGVAFALAYGLQHWLMGWLTGPGLGLGVMAAVVLSTVVCVALVWIVSRLYHRWVDGRIRSFLAREPSESE